MIGTEVYRTEGAPRSIAHLLAGSDENFSRDLPATLGRDPYEAITHRVSERTLRLMYFFESLVESGAVLGPKYDI